MKFWETLKVAVVILLVVWALKAWAIKPVQPPAELMQESANAQLIHRGVCDHDDRQVLCLVGYDEAANTFWFLFFNNDGVLTHVVTSHKNVEQTRWVHPMLSV
jgi:hypothetical protein